MPIIRTEELLSSGREEKTISTEELLSSTSQPIQGKREITTSALLGITEEKGDDTWNKMSSLGKVLDVLGRPGYAVKSTISQMQKETDEYLRKSGLPQEDIDNPASPSRMKALESMRPNVQARLEAAWRGLSGQERISANELWKKEGVEGVPLLGFATEVALDPLQFGGYSKILKGGGKVIKSIAKIPGVSETISKAKEAIRPITELISTKSPIPRINNLVDEWLSKRHHMKGKTIQYATQTRQAVSSISRVSKRTPAEVGKRIANIMELENYPEELAKVVPDILPQERALANTLHSHYQSMIVDEMKNGVPISPLSSSRSTKVEKLRKNLDVLRNSYGRELTRTRNKLRKELSVYGDKKMKEFISSQEGKKVLLENTKYDTQISAIGKLDDAVAKVETQMDALDKMRLEQLSKGAPTDMLKSVDAQLAKLENQYWYLHSEIAERLQNIPSSATTLRYQQKIDEIANLLSNDIEVNLGPHGVSLAKRIMETEEKMGKLPAYSSGRPRGDARKLLKQLTVERGKREFGYFPRITTTEAKQLLSGMQIGKSKLWTPQMMNALKRRTEDFTLDEFNTFVKEHGLTSLDGRTIEQFFISDPAYGVATRGFRSAKAVSSANFLQQMGREFGFAIEEAPSTYIRLPDNVVKLNPSLRGKVFPPEVASEIGRMSLYYLDPSYSGGAWRNFLKHFDTMQNTWKQWQLAVFPKYHLRNMVGNMWNNYLADVDPTTYIRAQAMQAYRKYKGTPLMGNVVRKQLRTLGMNVDDVDKVLDSAEQLGVVSGGWYSADIDYSIKKALGKKNVLDKGMAVGATIENNARLAHFLDRLQNKGKNVEEAALSVKKYLFDYGDLTHFERTVLKRLFPFYTWTRKNIPLQLESFANNPEKFMPIAVPIRTREPKDLLRLKYTNPNLYQRLPLELQRNIDTITYIPLEGIIPAADLSKLARPQDIVYDLLSPFVKEPIQQSLNKDIYFNQPIQSYRGETQPILNVDIPVRIRHLLSTISPAARITREIDKVVGKQDKKLPLNNVERLFATSLSTVYKSDLRQLRSRAISKIMKEVDELTRGAAAAKRNGRDTEFKEIKKTLREVINDMKEVR